MPAGTNFLTTAATPCRVPAKYSRLRMLAVEDHLRRQRVALVHVDEGLVHRVVREHDRVDGDRCPAGAGDGVAQMQPRATGDRAESRVPTIRASAGGRRRRARDAARAARRIAPSRSATTDGSSSRSAGATCRSCATSKMCATSDTSSDDFCDLDVEVAERHRMCGCDGRDRQTRHSAINPRRMPFMGKAMVT